MNVAETTRTFLDFFGERGHRVVQGSSLVPPDGAPDEEAVAHPQARTRSVAKRMWTSWKRRRGYQLRRRCRRSSSET